MASAHRLHDGARRQHAPELLAKTTTIGRDWSVAAPPGASAGGHAEPFGHVPEQSGDPPGFAHVVGPRHHPRELPHHPTVLKWISKACSAHAAAARRPHGAGKPSGSSITDDVLLEHHVAHLDKTVPGGRPQMPYSARLQYTTRTVGIHEQDVPIRTTSSKAPTGASAPRCCTGAGNARTGPGPRRAATDSRSLYSASPLRACIASSSRAGQQAPASFGSAAGDRPSTAGPGLDGDSRPTPPTPVCNTCCELVPAIPAVLVVRPAVDEITQPEPHPGVAGAGFNGPIDPYSLAPAGQSLDAATGIRRQSRK